MVNIWVWHREQYDSTYAVNRDLESQAQNEDGRQSWHLILVAC